MRDLGAHRVVLVVRGAGGAQLGMRSPGKGDATARAGVDRCGMPFGASG